MSPEKEPVELPRLCLIADKFTDPRRGAIIEKVVSSGHVPWVQIRDHRARRALFRGRGECMVDRLRSESPDVLISINADIGLARNLRAALHVGARAGGVRSLRNELGEDAIIGYSAHAVDEAVRAAEEGANYITFSPIFPTSSKPHHPGVGLDALREACRAVKSAEVIALGGITPDRIAECLSAGAHGVAVLSGILQATDAVEAARDYAVRLDS